MDMITLCDPFCLQCRFAHVTPVVIRNCEECIKVLKDKWKRGQIEMDKCGILWECKDECRNRID